jgi:hypothetical protein
MAKHNSQKAQRAAEAADFLARVQGAIEDGHRAAADAFAEFSKTTDHNSEGRIIDIFGGAWVTVWKSSRASIIRTTSSIDHSRVSIHAAHCGRGSQRPVSPNEVVLECDHLRVVSEVLPECVCRAGEPPHCHPHHEVRAVNVGRASDSDFP